MNPEPRRSGFQPAGSRGIPGGFEISNLKSQIPGPPEPADRMSALQVHGKRRPPISDAHSGQEPGCRRSQGAALAFAESVRMSGGSHVELSVNHGRGGKDFFAEVASSQDRQAISRGPDNDETALRSR